MLIRFAPMAAAMAVLFIGADASVSLAFHPFEGSGQVGGFNYLYIDFEPGGDRRITYRSCGTSPAPEWAAGVERWDAALGSTMEFDPVSCVSSAKATLAWEGHEGWFCSSGAWACLVDPTQRGHWTTHGSHRDWIDALIVFDFGKWYGSGPFDVPSPKDKWWAYMSAHEWGHSMSLADHVSSDCAEDTLMLNYFAGTLPANPCDQSPTAGDTSSVLCLYNPVCDTAGVWRSGQWHLRYSNSTGAADVSFTYGDATDVPIAGDWDGDGDDTAGVYRPSTRQFHLSNNNSTTAITVTWGNTGDVPIVGDWDANGTDTIGLYRPSTRQFFLSNSNTAPSAAWTVTYGDPGDVPLAGDWNGDRWDTIGVYRPSTTGFHLTNNNYAASYSFNFGNAGDTSVDGNWDGGGVDFGDDTIGVWRSAAWYLRNSNTAGAGEISFGYGLSTDKPLVGDWR